MAIATAATAAIPSIKGSSIFQWINAAVITASDSTVGMVGWAGCSQACLYLKCTAASGTSPTLDVYIQKLLPDKTTWHDIAHFTQLTGTGGRVMHLVTGGNKEEPQQTRTLAAATVNAVSFSGTWRVDAVVAATTPSFTISLWVEIQ